MTNYEKYRDMLVKSNYPSELENNFCNKFVGPKVLKSMGKKCSAVRCDQCHMLVSIWLLDQYKEPKEPEVDWSKVPVDTKIYVKDAQEDKWCKRHFAKYEEGKIFTWYYGRTSWSAENKDEVTSWEYGKLIAVE